MSFSIIVDKDFTLYVEEDDEDEEDVVPVENVPVEAQLEWEGRKTAFVFNGHVDIKEELDFEDNYLSIDQYVDINEIKTEIQLESEEDEAEDLPKIINSYFNVESSPEEELLPVAEENDLGHKCSPEEEMPLAAEPNDFNNKCSPEEEMPSVAEENDFNNKCSPEEEMPSVAEENDLGNKCSPEEEMHVVAEPNDFNNKCSPEEEMPSVAEENDLGNKCSPEEEMHVVAEPNDFNNKSNLPDAEEDDFGNKCGPEEEVPPVAEESLPEITLKVRSTPPDEIPKIQDDIVPEKCPNITADLKPNVPKTPTGSANSSEVLDQKKKPANMARPLKEPLDKRKTSPKTFKPRQRQNNNNNNYNKQLVPYKQPRTRYENDQSNRSNALVPMTHNRNEHYPRWRQNHRRRNSRRQDQVFQNPALAPLQYRQPQNVSLYNQTYSTILNAINQALGQQTNQSFQRSERAVFRFQNTQQQVSQWKSPFAVAPTVWDGNFAARGPVVHAAQQQTYSTILQAVTQLNQRVATQNYQNFTFQMSLQSSFGSF